MTCINCGKEFFTDWRKSSKSRKLQPNCCSRKCNSQLNGKSNTSKHTDQKISKCKNCGRTLRPNNLLKHEKSCDGSGKLTHERRKGSLKGKTYNQIYGEKIALEKRINLSEKAKVVSVFCNPDFWTDERRILKSIEKINFYKKYPEKHPNRILAGNRSKINYPESLVFNKLTELDIAFEYQKRIGTFYIDFFIEIEEKIYFIEVDGKYYHKDIEKDKNREDKIKNMCDGIFIRLDASKVLNELENKFIKIIGS